MTPVAYLKDRMPAVCIVLICALAIGSAVATLGAGTDAAVLLSLFVVLSGAGGFCGITFEYGVSTGSWANWRLG